MTMRTLALAVVGAPSPVPVQPDRRCRARVLERNSSVHPRKRVEGAVLYQRHRAGGIYGDLRAVVRSASPSRQPVRDEAAGATGGCRDGQRSRGGLDIGVYAVAVVDGDDVPRPAAPSSTAFNVSLVGVGASFTG